MLFRQHRGSLDASMKTLFECADRRALVDHCAALLHPWGIEVTDAMVHVVPYIGSSDDRIGWASTWVVKLDGYGVLGFTDSSASFDQ